MRALILMSFLLLAGCAGDRAMRNSPDFKAGYSDGCASASLQGANPRDTSLNRDEESYRSNAAYRGGWGAGFGACRAMTRSQSGGPPALPRTP